MEYSPLESTESEKRAGAAVLGGAGGWSSSAVELVTVTVSASFVAAVKVPAPPIDNAGTSSCRGTARPALPVWIRIGAMAVTPETPEHPPRLKCGPMMVTAGRTEAAAGDGATGRAISRVLPPLILMGG